MSLLINFSIFPLDKGESVSQYVARAEVMEVVTRCFEELKQDCSRVYMGITGDYRKIRSDRIVSKVESVEEKLEI
jgi:uncharacterized protein YqgV (UPF0045/DUF77 family)